MKFKNNGLGWMGKEKEEKRESTLNYYSFGGESLPFTAI